MQRPPSRSIPDLNKTDTKRFFSRVPDRPVEGCWLWRGYKNPQGYGVLDIRNMNYLASHLSWKIHRGPMPEGKTCLPTTCRNPLCVRPEHLLPSTQGEVASMALARGLARPGGREASQASRVSAQLDLRDRTSKQTFPKKENPDPHESSNFSGSPPPSFPQSEPWVIDAESDLGPEAAQILDKTRSDMAARDARRYGGRPPHSARED